jgi:putative oxidoreductase
MRLYWGWQFFLTGQGKLMNLEQVTGFFTDLGIPMPYFNAVMAGSVECFGGILLLLGLGSRFVSIPLASTMVVAYLTAHRDVLINIFEKPEDVITADPFLFLLTSIIILAFGPGFFSLDKIIGHFAYKQAEDVCQKQQTNTIKNITPLSI